MKKDRSIPKGIFYDFRKKRYVVNYYNRELKRNFIKGVFLEHELDKAIEFQEDMLAEIEASKNKVLPVQIISNTGQVLDNYDNVFAYGIMDNCIIPAIVRANVQIDDIVYPSALYTLTKQGIKYIPYTGVAYAEKEMAIRSLGK